MSSSTMDFGVGGGVDFELMDQSTKLNTPPTSTPISIVTAYLNGVARTQCARTTPSASVHTLIPGAMCLAKYRCRGMYGPASLTPKRTARGTSVVMFVPSRVTPVPVIAGPTASGKSDLAVEAALALIAKGRPAEIVTADAYQIYCGLDIGTAKPTLAERRGIPHHLINIVEPTERFTVADWLTAANNAIADIQRRGAVPIVVGGTHLYIKALLDGLFDGPPADAALRDELRALGRDALRAELEHIDPAAAARIHPNDERRTIRAIEVFRLTGKTITSQQTQWDATPSPASAQSPVPSAFSLFTLAWPTEELNRRINARVRGMMDSGLLAEVRALRQQARLGPQAREALGYKQLIEHLEGRCTEDEALERIKVETRRFAKNQRTWLRRLGMTPGAMSLDCAVVSREDMLSMVQASLTR